MRRAIDRVVRAAVPDRQIVLQKGYEMGHKRWNAAGRSGAEISVRTRGRRSKVNDEANINAVRNALEKNCQASSEPCLNSQREWVPAVVLTKRKNVIFEETEGLQEQMTSYCFNSIVKRHLKEFKAPRRLTDYCQICADFDDKVLPDMRKLVEKSQQELREQLPDYFVPWDRHAENEQYKDKPALLISDLAHYIQMHDRKTKCSEHRNTEFPCGCSSLRRGCADILALREVEIQRGVELRAMSKLVGSYNHHRASNELQKPAIDALLKSPSLGRLAILADWKELLSLPLQAKATGEAFYGSARKEISIFGVVVNFSRV